MSLKPYELDLKVFRFCAKSDYLPYYKRFKFDLFPTNKITLYELLGKIKESDESFMYEDCGDIALKIDNCTITKDVALLDIVKEFGVEFEINPISKSLAIDDLIIDKREYKSKLSIFGEILTKEDIELFNSLYKFNYLSDFRDIEPDYLGEAVFIFASYMSEKYIHHSQSIIDKISSIDSGVLLSPNLYKRVFPLNREISDRLDNLKRRVYAGYPCPNPQIKRVVDEHFSTYGFDAKTKYILKGTR